MTLFGYTETTIWRTCCYIQFLSAIFSFYLIQNEINLGIRPFLLACALLSGSLAVRYPRPQRTSRWIAYDNIETRTDLILTQLPDGNYTNGLMKSRTPIEVCELAIAAQICTVFGLTFQVAWTLATAIKGQSDKGECGTIGGEFDTLKWKYYASGRNCDTTAQRDTIAGAIYHYLKEKNHETICDTECLKLNLGGTWDGWLKLGQKDNFDEDVYCGPKLTFENCASGGNNDI
ncbi:uncharacterized protein BDV17DRAFT_291282 [Aspergillus undulatus]|uniref:uncharacterized protein n=1 Tax=Aspergillus undulatus TaxID=1810928 RepID=UPI003CCE14ED